MNENRHHHGHQHGAPSDISGAAKDPVCGMSVDPANAKHRAEHGGQTYFFCSAGCRAKFIAQPDTYLKKHAPTPRTGEVPSASGGKVLWTCPMHPQIVREGPGSCPICGMALEPMTPTGAEGENPELVSMTRRFWTGVALSVPLVFQARCSRADATC